MKNHEIIDGKLLQTNKKYSQLKQKQKDKIAAWMYEEMAAFYERTGKLPTEHRDEEVIDAIYARIEAAEIWIPYSEVEKHYRDKRTKLNHRVKRESEKDHHPTEKAMLMNMCMVCRGDEVLALDKISGNYHGTTFPGGHVELGETFAEAVIREVYEETGLTIKHPVLRGIYHWYRDGAHQIGLMYRATEFDGELKPSEEGAVYWISRAEYEKKDLAVGMPKVLQMMDDDNITECFMDVHPDGSITEHLF